MKKTLFIAMAFTTLIACNNSTKETATTQQPASQEEQVASEKTMEGNDGHTAQGSLDWAGTYEATLPCADCPGIKTIITLKNDNTYEYNAEYLERNTTTKSSGDIMWHDNGSVIHLKNNDIDVKLKVVENGLVGLDTEGKEMEGASKDLYSYKKIN